jgi:hypothetical protein
MRFDCKTVRNTDKNIVRRNRKCDFFGRANLLVYHRFAFCYSIVYKTDIFENLSYLSWRIRVKKKCCLLNEKYIFLS